MNKQYLATLSTQDSGSPASLSSTSSERPEAAAMALAISKFLCNYQRNANYRNFSANVKEMLIMEISLQISKKCKQVAAPELSLDDFQRRPVGRFRQRVRKLTKHLIQDCLSQMISNRCPSQMISNRVESWHGVSGYLAYYVRSGCFSQRELIWFGDRQLANARYCIKCQNVAISALVNVWDIWRTRIPHAGFLSMSTFGLEMRTHPTHVTLAQCTAHNEGFGQDGNIQQKKHKFQQFLLALDRYTIDFICLFVGHTFLLTLHHLFYT